MEGGEVFREIPEICWGMFRNVLLLPGICFRLLHLAILIDEVPHLNRKLSKKNMGKISGKCKMGPKFGQEISPLTRHDSFSLL